MESHLHTTTQTQDSDSIHMAKLLATPGFYSASDTTQCARAKASKGLDRATQYQGKDALMSTTQYLTRSWEIAQVSTQHSAQGNSLIEPRPRYTVLRANAYRCRWRRVLSEV